jgi:hypothetical protein
MTQTQNEQLEQTRDSDELALRAAWAAIFDRAPPKNVSRRLLELAGGYAAQAKLHGGLKPTLRRKLLHVSRGQRGSKRKTARQQEPILPPGSRVVREWHGRTYTVEALERGFVYAGQRYRSLSEIARAITGVRWSGPRFFGI